MRTHGYSRNFFEKAGKKEDEQNEVYLIKGDIEEVRACLEGNGYKTKNVMDDMVFTWDENGKIQITGSELGSFEIESENCPDCGQEYEYRKQTPDEREATNKEIEKLMKK
ncbi:MAG: hypothetical protein AABW67_02480 [Nanoarchaeota archaeon]